MNITEHFTIYCSPCDQPVLAEWADALISGDYEQCQSELFNGMGFCCLGVWEAMHVGIEAIEPQEDDERFYCYELPTDLPTPTLLPSKQLPQYLTVVCKKDFERNDFAIPAGAAVRLATLNDSGVTFEEIAALLRTTMALY